MSPLLFALAASVAAHLTPDGWGPVRIGMTQQEVESALGLRLTGEPVSDDGSCVEMAPAGKDRGIYFMFEDSKLTRISATRPSKLTTVSGIGVGASASEVRRAYGSGLRSERHTYQDPPAEYLTVWTLPGQRGIRFEIGENRRTEIIHAGTASIEYVEGCL